MLNMQECMDMIDLRSEDLQALGEHLTLTDALDLLNKISHLRTPHANLEHACYPGVDRRGSRPPNSTRSRHRPKKPKT